MKSRKKPARRKGSRPAVRKPKVHPELPLPAWLLAKYPGQLIIYSHEVDRVIGAAEDPDEAWRQAEASGVKGTWHSAYSDPLDFPPK